MGYLLDGLTECDVQAKSQPGTEALVQPVKQEDTPLPQRQVPPRPPPPPPRPVKQEHPPPPKLPKPEFDVEAEAIALKGKGKGGSALLGGREWYFGVRGRFAKGEFQDNSEAARTSGNRRQNEQWRSGSGRFGNKSKQGNSGWNKIFHTLTRNNEQDALKLFKQDFPAHLKPPKGWEELNGEGQAERWINMYRGKVSRARNQA